MSGVITAVVGTGLATTLIGGSMQAGAATDAANIQANSANQVNQLQYQMFQEQQKAMQPWVKSGEQNLNRLNYAMYGQLPASSGVKPQQSDYMKQSTPGFLEQMPQQLEQSANAAWDSWKWNPGSAATPDTAAYQAALDKYNATTPSAAQMGVQGGGLNPDWRFSTQDWKNSPEYEVYNNARNAALQRSQDTLMAQGAASGMYGSGTMANQLSQNMGQLYAQYDPLSLQTAQQNAIGARQNEYNILAGLSSPTGAQQVAQYAGQYGQNAGQNMIGAGNAQAAGQVGAANAWGNALTSGTNQVANAYGQYQGQQNFNQLLNTYQQPYQQLYQQPYQDPGYGSHTFTPSGGGYYQV